MLILFALPPLPPLLPLPPLKKNLEPKMAGQHQGEYVIDSKLPLYCIAAPVDGGKGVITNEGRGAPERVEGVGWEELGREMAR